MHFSRVVGGLADDLLLVFDKVLAVSWEDEAFGLIDASDDLPKCSGHQFGDYTHPALIIQNSKWTRKYADREYSADDPRAKRIVHYYLVSFNDLLHVLAESDPTASWILPSRA